MSNIGSSIRWSSVGSISVSVLQLVQVVILTKFLLPEDYGLVAICMIFIGLSRVILDFGLSTSIIYEKELSNTQLNTLLFINILLGILLAFLLFICSPLIAGFYENTDLQPLLAVLAISILFSGASAQGTALLKKNLRFKELSLIQVASYLCSLLVAVILAVSGYGAWALVAAYVGNTFIYLVLIWLVSSISMIDFRAISLESVKPQLSFGAANFGERIFTWLKKDIDSIIIGKFLGEEALGLYSIGRMLFQKSFQLVSAFYLPVQLPYYVRQESREDQVELSKVFSSAFLSLLLPVTVLIVIHRDFLVPVLFSDTWLDASTVILYLFPTWILRYIRVSFGPVFIARGKPRVSFLLALGLTLISGLCLSGMGYLWGIEGIYLGLFVTEVLGLILFFILGIRFFFRPSEIPGVFMELALPFIACLGYALYMGVSFGGFEISSLVAEFALIVLFAVVGFLLQSWFTRFFIRKTYDLVVDFLPLPATIKARISLPKEITS